MKVWENKLLSVTRPWKIAEWAVEGISAALLIFGAVIRLKAPALPGAAGGNSFAPTALLIAALCLYGGLTALGRMKKLWGNVAGIPAIAAPTAESDILTVIRVMLGYCKLIGLLTVVYLLLCAAAGIEPGIVFAPLSVGFIAAGCALLALFLLRLRRDLQKTEIQDDSHPQS